MRFEFWVHPLSCFMVGWQFTENCFEIHIGLFSFVWTNETPDYSGAFFNQRGRCRMMRQPEI